MLSVVMLNVVVLSVVMLSVVMLSVVMLNVVAPYKTFQSNNHFFTIKLTCWYHLIFVNKA
jgi:hypothetical protein